MATAPEEYRPVQRKPPPSQRNAGFYNTKSWVRASRLQRIREPLCRMCGEPATCVDHIKSLATGGDPFTPSNLQSLCRPCHHEKTVREQRGG